MLWKVFWPKCLVFVLFSFASTNLSMDLREWGRARIGLDELLYVTRTVSRVRVICKNKIKLLLAHLQLHHMKIVQ